MSFQVHRYHRIAGHLPPFLIVENTCRQFFRDICRKLILKKDICRKKTFLQVHYNHFQNPTCRKMALVENSNLKMLNPATCRKKLSTNGTCRKIKFENAKFSNLQKKLSTNAQFVVKFSACGGLFPLYSLYLCSVHAKKNRACGELFMETIPYW